MKPTVKFFEEEKKESSPARFVAEAAKTGEEEVQEELSLEKKQEGLPKEIKRKEYKWERDLLDDLEEFGLDDYKHIILDNNGRAVWEEMPGKEHTQVVLLFQREFARWGRENGHELEGGHGLRVVATSEPYLWLSRSFTNNARRIPDMSLFGPNRLNENGNIRGQDYEPMNPHVVIEISLTSSFSRKEQAAILDMMAFAGKGDYAALGRPNVAYLIDVLHSNDSPRADDPVYGFNVYQVRQIDLAPDIALTQTLRDELFPEHREDPNDPQNRPDVVRYRVGGNEDGAITITAQDLGLSAGNSFRVTCAQIREALEERGVEFVAQP